MSRSFGKAAPNKSTRMVKTAVLFLTVVVGCHVAIGAELSFLEKNPALKEQLLQWEREAPEAVKREIRTLRTEVSIDKAHAAFRLRDSGASTKGAILALIETFADRRQLIWMLTGSVNAPGNRTSPASEAVRTLGKIGTPAVEPLIAALMDESNSVRRSAAEALGEIKDLRAVEPLIAALKDGRYAVRSAAADELGEIKDLRAVEPLIAALKDEDAHVRSSAVRALRAITGRDFGQNQDEWLSWSEEQQQK